jgi:hypothetical protein
MFSLGLENKTTEFEGRVEPITALYSTSYYFASQSGAMDLWREGPIAATHSISNSACQPGLLDRPESGYTTKDKRLQGM